MELEYKANELNKKCLKIGIIVILSVLLLNELNIFIIDKYLVRIAVVSTSVIWLVALILLSKVSIKKAWVKYVILAVEIIGLYILYTFLTYHIILILAMPFLIAAYYPDKKVTVYVYIFSVICICVSIIAAYQVGLCDMNMTAFTHGVVWDYGEKAVIKIYKLTPSKVIQLVLFFAVPRSGILLMYAFTAQTIARSGREMQIQQRITEEFSKIDKMTGLYNKNTYIDDVRNIYAKKENVGVIFVDLNNLKKVNDKYGHDKGDEIIIALSKSIKYLLSEDINGYRIGGDEFVVFVDNATQGSIDSTIEKWKAYIEGYNQNHEDNKCSAAYGYAIGLGSDISDVIEEADKNMYECKKIMKSKGC